MVANMRVPTFTWNLEFYHWQQTLVVIFLDMTDSFHWFLRKCLQNAFVIWIIKFVRQSILSSKNVLSWQKQLIHVANQTSAGVLFLETTIVLQCPAEVFYVCLYFVTQNINKEYTQRPGLNKINNIYSLIKHSVKWSQQPFFFWCLAVKNTVVKCTWESLFWFMLIRHQQFCLPLLLHHWCKYCCSEKGKVVFSWIVLALGMPWKGLENSQGLWTIPCELTVSRMPCIVVSLVMSSLTLIPSVMAGLSPTDWGCL